jgi:hypothetical protein
VDSAVKETSECTETLILLIGINFLLQNISAIHLLPTLTAYNQLSSDLQKFKLHYRLPGRQFMKLDKNLVVGMVKFSGFKSQHDHKLLKLLSFIIITIIELMFN